MTLNLTPITPGTLTLTGTASGSIAIGPVFTVTDGSTDVVQPGTLKFSGATVSESPAGTALVTVSGGSQPEIDLGVITAVEVATGGPKLLYTPASGEIVYGGKVYAVTFTDVDRAVAVSTLAAMNAYVVANASIDANGPLLAYVDRDLQASMYSSPLDSLDPVKVGSAFSGLPVFLTEPIYAVWVTGTNGLPVETVPGVWQASHAFALGVWIIDSNNHLQHCTTAGTSKSGSHPVWDNAGSTTTDGSAVWTDEGVVPAAGTLHLLATRATPIAP